MKHRLLFFLLSLYPFLGYNQCEIEFYSVTAYCLETTIIISINSPDIGFGDGTEFEASFNNGPFLPVDNTNFFIDGIDSYPPRVTIDTPGIEQQNASLTVRPINDPTCSGEITFDIGPCPTTFNAFVNEFHYDNAGTDESEFVEIVFLHPFLTDTFSSYSVNLVDGATGEIYETESFMNLQDGYPIPTSNGFNYSPSLVWSLPTEGIQNGGPDGIAICGPQGLIEFISYEGSFTGVGGCIDGETSTNIGVMESEDTPTGYSIQKDRSNPISGEWFVGLNTVGEINILPVTLSTFSVRTENLSTILNWQTLSETNNKEFEVQRSYDGLDFSTIAVIVGQGDSNVPINYQYQDKDLVNGRIYYRLKQNDFDGQISYSDIISVNFEEGKDVAILSCNRQAFNMNSAIEASSFFQVYNSHGELITNKYINVAKGNQSIYFPTELFPGFYIIVLNVSEVQITKKVLIQ